MRAGEREVLYAHRHAERQKKTQKKRESRDHTRDASTFVRLLPMTDVRRRSGELCAAVWSGRRSAAGLPQDHVLPRYHVVLPVSTRSVVANRAGRPICFPAARN